MSKRLQVLFSEEAWSEIETITNEAGKDFEMGSINYSDVVNEMVLSAKVDIKALQMKHTDIRRSLRVMAGKSDLDLDSVIKSLNELRAKIGKKKSTQTEEKTNA